MKHLLAALTILTLTSQVSAKIDVIYGPDNRQDIYQVSNALHKRLALSTAAMINTKALGKGVRANVFDLLNITTLERGQNVCASEKFADQPTAATCSGFLVGPDTLVTAGHCFKSFSTPEDVCKNFAWVFGFQKTSASADPLKNIPIANIYTCKKVVDAQLSATADYAIIKLDRKVVGKLPLTFRKSGRIANTANLVVIGHPTGLPLKVSPGGKVTRNVDPTRFSTTLDTFHGNSGSAVFDATTGQVEGILIQGKNDYTLSKKDDPKSCKVVNKCDDLGNNCSAGAETGPIQWGEVVLRIENIAAKIEAANKL